MLERLTMTTKIFLLLVLSAWTAKFEEVKWPEKNFHMTEKKLWGSEVDPKKKSDKVKRYDVASYAEKNGPFIFEFISQVFGENPIYDVSDTQNTNIPNNYQNGLYIFFIEHGMRKYPIYVGMTSRTFRQRFMEHLNAKVIHYYNQNNPGFPENIPFQARSHYPLKVICVQSSPVVAKFVESALLDHFDFCLNAVENNNIRVNIDLSHQFAIHQSRQSFHITFGNLVTELENVNSRYQYWYLNG